MQFSTLQKDMIQAMKDHDKVRKDAISTLVSATKKLAIDAGCRDDIPDDMTDQAILKEIKSVKEQIDTCPDSRAELKAEYEARLKVFEEYAPKMLSAEEVEAVLKERFADVIATGNKGQIMKSVMPELKGKADGKVINEVIAKMLG
ncbi:MAG: GatB/YqeY domain-containing protein [Lachnospiraceae bacterium]|nr:GatB/YqeY domain-containing protein [Lachnospiraceae bacterium]